MVIEGLRAAFDDVDLARDALYWHYPHNRPDVTYYMGSSILIGDWKFYEGYSVIEDALFNLKDDPSEKTDLAAKNPEKAGHLRKRLMAILSELDAEMPTRKKTK